MIVEPLEMTLESRDFSVADGARSPGLHLSQILADLDAVRGGAKYPERAPATRQLYFATGFIWEQIIQRIFLETAVKSRNGRLVRPGEFHLDGIWMSPDALDTEDWAIEEYKATYLASTRPIDDPAFWIWIIQMKCYCKAAATRTARLRAWFVAGDWRGSGPQVRAWTFHFTDRDVEDAFAMVRNHAQWKGWL